MPKYLADGNRHISLLSATPTDPAAIDVTTSNGGTDMSDFVLTTSVLGPTGSDTIAEKVFSSQGNAEAFGPSNVSGNYLDIHRYYDAADSQPDDTDDASWTALKTKGTTVRLLWRISAKASATAFTAGDEYRYIEYTTDDPQDQSGEGYIKFRIPLAFAGVMALDDVVVADA